jgi:uncharacterized protein (TIGR02421 family)
MEVFAELDARLVAATQDIRVLGLLAWPSRILAEFLPDWERGSPRMPRIEHPRLDYSKEIEALRDIMAGCDAYHPVGRFIYRTAESYVIAADMIQSMGTPAFTELSRALYGAPTDPIGPTGVTNLDACRHFVGMSDDFIQSCYLPDADYCLSAQHVAEELRKRLAPVFVRHPIKVVIDPGMSSKAAAGARRVRLREATCFSDYDVQQLVEHEVFIHSLTAINGREQPYLKSMGLGAPRTTCTQEGLATFAELITDAIDINRLRRIALRVQAIQIALEGADFIEVCRFFLDAGQNHQESFYSAMRVFRGGDVNGRIAFTKDAVYLQGLIYVHTFMLKAIQSGKPEYVHYLFSGRMALGDVIELDPWFRDGTVAPPLYEPRWALNRPALVAFLIYSVFNTRLELGAIELGDFREQDLAGKPCALSSMPPDLPVAIGKAPPR